VRPILLFLGSVASGLLTTVASLILLLLLIFSSLRHAGAFPSNQLIALDPISIFHQMFGRAGAIALPLLIFGLGCAAGYRFLSKRLHA
jgi:hypothetical protein